MKHSFCPTPLGNLVNICSYGQHPILLYMLKINRVIIAEQTGYSWESLPTRNSGAPTFERREALEPRFCIIRPHTPARETLVSQVVITLVGHHLCWWLINVQAGSNPSGV